MTDLHAPTAPRRAARRGRRSRAGLAAAALLLAAVPAVAGCGTGFNSASRTVRPNAGAGVTGSLKVNNVWVVVDPGTREAQVIGAVANTGTTPDRVTGAKASGVPALVTGTTAIGALACNRTVVSAGTVIIPANRSVGFGRPGCPQLSLLIGAVFRPGRVASVTLMFARAAALTVNAQIVADTGLFTEYQPPHVIVSLPPAAPIRPGATPTTTASASATPTSTSTGTTATATAGPTATASAAALVRRSASAGTSPSPSATR